MSPLGQHIRTHLEDNRVIATSAKERRILARVVLKHGREDGLLAFSMPDNHLHLQAACSDRAASGLSQRITSSLKQRLGLPVSFVTYPHEPIGDQRYMVNTFRYVVTQHERHGVALGPFLEASNIPDLLGLRLLGEHTRELLQNRLPRVRQTTVLQWLGLSELEPADGPLDGLLDATLAATALDTLTGRSDPVVQARRALLEVAGSRLPTDDAAQLLALSRRAVNKMKGRPVKPALVHAIRLQLGLAQLLKNR